MTHIVNEMCIKCKYKDCVEVCPVDCFYEGKYTLVINPDECIDCGVCVPECPVKAIQSDLEEDLNPIWLKINSELSQKWPNVTEKGQACPDADKYAEEKEKYKKYKDIMSEG